jgi:phosphoserine phosphatase
LRIIFVRHGQTIYNVESRYQGHTDAPLSDLGRRQSIMAARALADERIAAVYSSDLGRAVQTAEAIAARHDLPVRTDLRLRECAFGDWEGLTVSQIEERYPDLFASYRQDSVAHRAPGGERLEALQARVAAAIDDIARAHSDDTVVVVTHGGPIRAFLCHAFGTDLESFRRLHLDNCGITVFSLEAGAHWFLERLNDTCHLAEFKDIKHYHDETAAQNKAL